MTNFELALALVKLGVVTGAALDGGGSTAMAFDGRLLNRPSDKGGERAVSEALLHRLLGRPGARTELSPSLSPNGDGVAETQQLAYKVVRPSTVTAQLIGPDGVARQSFRPAAPGTYPFSWNGLTATGTSSPREPGGGR